MLGHSTRIGYSRGHKRWLPCRACNFQSLMYPAVFCSTLFGFFPIKYKNGEYAISKIRLAFSALMACFYLAIQVFVLYAVHFSDTNDAIVETMPENFFALLDGTIPMMMCLSSYSRSLMFQRVFKISRILSLQDFNDMAKLLHMTYILHFFYHMIHVLLYYANKENIPVAQRYITLFIWAASSEGVLFYLTCVRVLGASFKTINDSLKRLREPSTNCLSEWTEEHPSRRQGAMLLMKVKYYEAIHEEISDTVEHLNKSSRTVNTIFAAGTFVLVTFNLHIYMQWIFTGDRLSMDIYTVYECCFYGILRLSMFILLVWVCESSTSHATEIKTTIHDLANNCIDDTVKRELQYFDLQVVHRDNAITTTAFKINGKLLSQVLSGIATYIMILFQFLMSNNCNN